MREASIFLLNAWHTSNTALKLFFSCNWMLKNCYLGENIAGQRLWSAAHSSHTAAANKHFLYTLILLIISATHSPPPMLVKIPSTFFPQQILECGGSSTPDTLLTSYPLSRLHSHQVNTSQVQKSSLNLFSFAPNLHVQEPTKNFELSTYKVENILMLKSAPLPTLYS